MCDRRSYFEHLVKSFFTEGNHFAVIIEVQVFFYVFKKDWLSKYSHIGCPRSLTNTVADVAQDTWTFSIKQQKNFQLFPCEHEWYRQVSLHCIQITLLRNAFHHSFTKKLSKIFPGFRYAFKGKNKFYHFFPPRKILEKSSSGPPWKTYFRRPCLNH